MLLLGLKDDIREAVRRICRNPRTSLFAVGTLALGIGAATAVFAMAYTALIAPPPYRYGERLVNVYGFRNELSTQGVSVSDAADYRLEAGLFDAIALSGYAEFSWTGQSLSGFDGAEVLRGLRVTADYFTVLDQPMAIGRGFLPGEDGPGAERVAVISHALWQQRFAGRPEIVGATMTLNGEVHTIVGVANQRFLTYAPYEVKVWAPIAAATQPRNSRQYSCFARLTEGVTLERARQQLDALNARLEKTYPDTNEGYRANLEPLLEKFHRTVRPALLALAGFVLCLLLISAANVASLLLARATKQVRELSIRAALGADRLRLYRMILTESLLLALLASAGGALLAVWLLAGARALLPVTLQFSWIIAIDSRVFAVALLVAALTGFLAGIAPAFESFRLAAGGLRPSFRRQRLLRTIVTVEVALAAMLFVGAGLLGKSFVELVNRPLGYETDQLLGMRVRLQGERYQGYDRKAAFWADLIERAGAIPGVVQAASVSDLPMGWQYSGGRFQVAGPGRRSR